jgi:FKBP-type peptidyl-prolyl cis-trans isomerase FklB
MRRLFILLFFCALAPGFALAQTGKALKTNADSLGYALGMNIGNDFKKQGIPADMDALIQGLQDAMGGKPTQLTEAQSRTLWMAYQQTQQQRAAAEKKAKADANLKKGEEFLAQNKLKPGILVLPNGLQYEVVVEGTGKNPATTDKVTTHYRGTLIDGTEFDSSYKRGQPATFPVTGVIQAWQTILPMMKEGGKVKIYSPSNLAYGPQGQGATIGPNEVLIFEIELIKVN